MVAFCFISSGKTVLRAMNISFWSNILTERTPNCLILIEVHTFPFAVAFFKTYREFLDKWMHIL